MTCLRKTRVTAAEVFATDKDKQWVCRIHKWIGSEGFIEIETELWDVTWFDTVVAGRAAYEMLGVPWQLVMLGDERG